jgi:hypothetical protein
VWKGRRGVGLGNGGGCFEFVARYELIVVAMREGAKGDFGMRRAWESV